jgi:hypothetical protein
MRGRNSTKHITRSFDKEYDGYDKDRVRKVLNHTSKYKHSVKAFN